MESSKSNHLMDALPKYHDKKKEDSSPLVHLHSRCLLIQEQIKKIIKYGVHSRCYMSAAGLHYTGDGDAARCDHCELEVSNWTIDMNPFIIHSKQKPDCPFIHSMKPSSVLNVSAYSSSSTTVARNTSTSNEQENSSKRQKIETIDSKSVSTNLLETNSLQQVRTRTFSRWPHRSIPTSAQMIESGFFNCNVGDRVICIYCNLICQQWTPHTDDPCEVHKTLSPSCIYVQSKLIHPAASPIIIVNETTLGTISTNHLSTSTNFDTLRSNEIVFTAACNPTYAELPKRHASFATWPNENLPSVDDLIRAGFFYTGKKTIVTCFYCNGSLQNWGANDNPMIEHARWFPYCAYAKQLCGDQMYRKIQESKRAQQERARANEANSGVALNTNMTINSEELLIPDESTLSRLVAARLDLPISQRLLDQNYKLSIIKRCWEDQLRLKQNDFVSDCDLYVACLILQKQIEHIDGKKENIVIPSIKMKQITEQSETGMHETTSTTSNTKDVPITTSQQSSIDPVSKSTTSSSQDVIKTTKPSISTGNNKDQSVNSSSENLCVLCLTEEKKLACIPCGHLATCVPCGHSLRSCPICRRGIEAFVRIYL